MAFYIAFSNIPYCGGAESGFLCFSGPEIRIYRCVFFPGEYYFYRQINNNKNAGFIVFWEWFKMRVFEGDNEVVM
ncbi:hypothetical protein CO693_19355 [Morganella morganii]|nr:hypothetical protein CO693_19355 [Morganella morganii]